MTQLTKDSKTNLALVKGLINKSHANKILADLTFAQAILEAALLSSPPSELAWKHNNLFGMKPGKLIPKGTANPGVIELATHEFIDGRMTIQLQPFLANKDVEDSIQQHLKLLTDLSRYDNLETAKTFEEAAKLIWKDGYATDPHYPEKLISVYNAHVKE